MLPIWPQPKEKTRTRCSIALVRGQKEDWSEDTPGEACFQWGGPNIMEESPKFHGPPRFPLFALHAQRGEWGSTTLHTAKGTSDSHLKWVSSRCGTSRPWPYTILTTRMAICFWCPRMAKQMRQTIRACTHSLQYEDGLPKGPLFPIVTTAPLDLLHVNFTSIETTLEPNQSPRVTNILVPQDHFRKHVLVYVTPDQTAKTIAKFLYGGYISISGALARLLSDRGAGFTSNVHEELCKILGIKWLWTMPYHPQTNGLVERSHQMIMCMIGKLREDKKLTGHLIWLK